LDILGPWMQSELAHLVRCATQRRIYQAGSGQSPLTVIPDCPVKVPALLLIGPLVNLVILNLVFWQFCRAYTRRLPNPGAHSTQRNESHHVVMKTRLRKHLPISRVVYTVTEQTADLARTYDAEINRNRKTLPRLLDRAAFAVVGDKLTYVSGRPLISSETTLRISWNHLISSLA